VKVPEAARIVKTPLVWQEWAGQLEKHPDRRWESFRVRFSGKASELKSCSRNIKSAEENAQVV